MPRKTKSLTNSHFGHNIEKRLGNVRLFDFSERFQSLDHRLWGIVQSLKIFKVICRTEIIQTPFVSRSSFTVDCL